MALQHMFLKLTSQSSGVVTGETDDPEHAGEIGVLDWSWGMTSPTAVGSGAPTGRVRYDALLLTKQADTASTALMSIMNANELCTAVLSVRKAGGEAYDYFVVKLEKARIVNFKIASAISSTGAPALMESLEFTFKTIEIEYKGQSSTGGAEGGSIFWGDAYPDT